MRRDATLEKQREFNGKLLLFFLCFTIFSLPFYNVFVSLGLGFSIFFLLVKLSTRRKPVISSPLNLPIAVFCAVCLLSLIVSTDKGETLIGIRKLFLHVFFYLALMNSVTDKKRLGWLVFFLIFSLSIVSLDGAYQFIQGEDWFSARPLMIYPNLGVARLTASFLQAGALGIYLGVMIPILTALTLYYLRGAQKIAAGFILLSALGVLVMTLAPGAAFGFYAAMILFVILKKEHRFFIAAFLILGLLVGYIFLPKTITRWPDGSLFGTFFGRIEMWMIAFKLIMGRPLLGVGLHTFPQNFKRLCVPGVPFCDREGAPYAHNMYLHLGSEIGLLGLAAFFWIIFAAFKQLRTVYRSTQDGFVKSTALGLSGNITAFLVHGLLESSFQTSHGALLFWLALGLAASLKQITLPLKNIDFMKK